MRLKRHDEVPSRGDGRRATIYPGRQYNCLVLHLIATAKFVRALHLDQ